MKTFNHISFLFLLTLFIGLVCSCDDHEAIDANIYPGHVVTTDHKIMSLSDFRSRGNVRAEGVVFSVATPDHPMLVVLLDEIERCQYADSLFVQTTSADETAYDGFENTVKMQNSFDMKTMHGSPLGSRVIDYQSNGQSAYIPSVAEMNVLFASLSQVNPTLKALGGTPVTVSDDCWYWTSTEVSANAANQSWLYSTASGSYQATLKTEYHRARPITCIYY